MACDLPKNDMLLTIWLVLFSIAKGSFFIWHSTILFNFTEPYLKHLPTDMLGILLVCSASLLMIGVLIDKKRWRYFGIISLGGSWGALTFLAFTYHLGSGYPHSNFISYGFALLLTLIVAYKGVYAD